MSVTMTYKSDKYSALVHLREYLKQIDTLLDDIDELDPYGDIVQNFEDECRERHTKRLLKMVNKDIKKLSK